MIGRLVIGGMFLCHATLVSGQTINDAKNLRTKLFVTNGYDKKFRPLFNQSDVVDITVDFTLLAINGLDEVGEVLKTTGFLSISWHDEFLTWNSTDYDGLDYYFLPQDDVWKPDVALQNSVQEYKNLGVSSLYVQVDEFGQVFWNPFQVFESTCSMNIEHFPFDIQTCTLTFVAWSYGKVELTLYSETGIELTRYQPNSAWDVIATSWSEQTIGGEVSIDFNIKMKRKPLYVLLSVILPISLLAMLNIFVFVLPCASGERAGYAVTVFLSLAVFLTIVFATLPANSDTVAILTIYLIVQTVQSTLITMMALIMLRMYFFGDDVKLPACAIAMLNLSGRLQCNRGGKRVNKVTDVFSLERQASAVVEDVSNAKKVDREPTRGGSEASLQDGEQGTPYTWVQFINLLDVICLIFFSVVFVLSTTKDKSQQR